MSKLSYMPFFVQEFEADTAHISILEDGIYCRLLRLCWRSPGCKLPDDHDWIARKIRAGSAEEVDAMKSILDEFFTARRGKIFSKRLLSEYERISVTVRKRKEAGKLGGRAKALKNNETMSSNAKAKTWPGLHNKDKDKDIYNTPPLSPPRGERASAKKGKGFVKLRTSKDAAEAYIERRGLNNDEQD